MRIALQVSMYTSIWVSIESELGTGVTVKRTGMYGVAVPSLAAAAAAAAAAAFFFPLFLGGLEKK
jgi:hypothetical protein